MMMQYLTNDTTILVCPAVTGISRMGIAHETLRADLIQVL
jgi:hypothetical protein